jgi:hypothetical protein
MILLRQGRLLKEERFIFEVNKNYQDVYHQILPRAKNCFQGGGLFADITQVEGNIDSNKRLGNRRSIQLSYGGV